MLSPRMKSSTQTRSEDRKLSEVARHIKVPSGIKTTGWPSVRDRCKVMGIPFDRWQDGIGRLVLGKRSDGLYACGIGGAVMSIPRQTGKTYTIGGLIFALCTLQVGLTVIWTAHHSRTANETFDSMRSMAAKPKVKPYIKFVRAANGEQEIAFSNGSRILFGARESGFGRGFAEVDVLVLDEAQILTENAMSNMVPATNASPNGIVFMMGTPPRPTDPGEVFKNRRDDALSGDEDTLYIEFSADSDARLDDWGQLAKANPSFPHRTSRTAILRMRKLLGSDENFKREAYGIWDTDNLGEAVIQKSWWDSTVLGADDPLPDGGVTSFGVRFSADGSWVSLAGAMKFGNDDPIFVELIESKSMAYGIDWITAFLAERWRDVSMIVIDGKSDATALHQALVRAGVNQSAINFGKGMIQAPQAADAYSTFVNAARAGEIWHSDDEGQAELDKSAATSKRRKIGVAGAFGFEPMRVGTDNCVPLEAAALARYAASVSKRRPAGAKRVGGAIAM